MKLFDLMSPIVAKLSTYMWGVVLMMGSKLALTIKFHKAHALLLLT